MEKQLSPLEHEILQHIYDVAKIPIDWDKFAKKHVADKKAVTNALAHLIKDRWIDSKHRLNNKAMAYMIVGLKYDIAEWRRHFPGAIEGDMGWQMVRERLLKLPPGQRDKYLNIYTFYTYRRYLELDAFDKDDGGFLPLWSMDLTDSAGHATDALKFIEKITMDLIDDGRIPLDVIMDIYEVPQEVRKQNPDMSKEDVKFMIRKYLEKAVSGPSFF